MLILYNEMIIGQSSPGTYPICEITNLLKNFKKDLWLKI